VGLAAGVVKGIRIILWHYKVFQKFIGGFPGVFPSSLRCVAEKVLKMGYVWAPVGSCPLMVRDNRHDSAYLFGAICPARAVGAAVIMPAANAEAMNEHLNEISTQVARGAHAVLVCDRAGWHQTGGRLRMPDNITLLPLPPYAPELNPMENVWEYLRGNKLSRLVWDSYEAIVAACKEGWDFLINDPDRIRSIGHRDWACVSV
jgi:hypothetical protein